SGCGKGPTIAEGVLHRGQPPLVRQACQHLRGSRQRAIVQLLGDKLTEPQIGLGLLPRLLVPLSDLWSKGFDECLCMLEEEPPIVRAECPQRLPAQLVGLLQDGRDKGHVVLLSPSRRSRNGLGW